MAAPGCVLIIDVGEPSALYLNGTPLPTANCDLEVVVVIEHD
jgi:hypothetical protein